jgi:hypothetical protein
VTAENIKGNGNMESSMEKVNFIILITKPGKKEYGVMEEEFNGIILLHHKV